MCVYTSKSFALKPFLRPTDFAYVNNLMIVRLSVIVLLVRVDALFLIVVLFLLGHDPIFDAMKTGSIFNQAYPIFVSVVPPNGLLYLTVNMALGPLPVTLVTNLDTPCKHFPGLRSYLTLTATPNTIPTTKVSSR